MKSTIAFAAAVVAILASTQGVEGQGRAQYRDFQLGGSLASVATLAGIAPTEAKVIHQRPVLLQVLEWRPSHWLTGSTTVQSDPIQQVVFSFYNDQLFKVIVDYDRQRTDGLTDDDLIEALSQVYGPPLKAAAKRASGRPLAADTESGVAIAQWGGDDYAVALYRSTYATAFRLIVTLPRLDALARTADAESNRLDVREAPQREVARQKKEVDDARVTQEKARAANKPTFRP